MPRTSREWLDALLGGGQPTEADIRQLVIDCPTEDGVFECKAGPWVAGKGAAAQLREYVAAFANVSGGVVVLGYDRARSAFGNAKPPGRAALEDWMATATALLRTHFHLPPRQWVVQMAEGAVGVIVISRALTLIPIDEGGRRRYPVRWGATVEDLPQDLALDILVGRRRNPFLRVRLIGARYGRRDDEQEDLGKSDVKGFELDLRVTVENAGLVFAAGTRVGLVGWALRSSDAAPSLRESVDAVQPYAEEWHLPWTLSHFRNERDQGAGNFRGGLDLAPFDISSERIAIRTLPRFRDISGAARDGDARWRGEIRGRVKWHAGLYILAENTDPLWHRLTVDYDDDATFTDMNGPIQRAHLEPVDGRPLVAVEFRPFA